MAKTLRLTEGIDKVLYFSTSSASNGTESILAVKNNSEAIFKFNLDALKGKQVISAVYKVYMSSAHNISNSWLQGCYFNSDWVENTGNTRPNYAGGVGLNINLNITQQWLYGDITTLVKKWIDGSVFNGGLGMFCQTYDSNIQPIMNLNSFQASTNRPYIEITYDDILPNTPTNLSPSGSAKQYNEDITFAWTYSPAYTGDIQKKYILSYSTDNGVNWIEKEVESNDTSYILAANTFIYFQHLLWKVKVFNESDISIESDSVNFDIIGIPRTPVITNDTTLDTPELTVVWQETNEQVSYRLKVLDSDQIIYDTQEVVGTENSHQVNVSLVNNKEYSIKLQVKNQYGVWSDETTKTITTAFPEPAQPDMDLSADNIRGTILVSCIKKSGILETHHFEVYRKEDLKGEYIKIGDDVKSEYSDYTVKSGKTYYYKIRAVTESGQYKESLEKEKAAFVKGSQLSLTSNYSNGINLKYNRTVQVKYMLDRYTTKFDGREKPVAEYGEHLSKYFTISFLIRDNEDIESITELLATNGTILYRDDRGRKIYGTVTQLQSNDNKKLKYNLNFTLQEVDYSEVV